MKLSEISIHRPVLASMMSLAIILFGLVALPRLPVRELPDVDPAHRGHVLTVYPGASAEVVETEVTERLEEAINSIEGIKVLTSESREQLSSITIEFNLSREIEACAQDVRDRVSPRARHPARRHRGAGGGQAGRRRPAHAVGGPVQRPLSTLELTGLAENLMKDRLQTVKGVSSIFIGGQKRYAIRLRLDAEKMAAHQVTLSDVEPGAGTQSVELPSGRVEGREREMTIQTRGELKTPEEFNRLVIRQRRRGLRCACGHWPGRGGRGGRARPGPLQRPSPRSDSAWSSNPRPTPSRWRAAIKAEVERIKPAAARGRGDLLCLR
jgi:multidrug efflux pump